MSNINKSFIKYSTNISVRVIEKVLRLIVGLFVGAWIARYLGPEQFGVFSYAQSFVGLFAVVASLGIDNILVREFVKKDYTLHQLISTALYLKFIGFIIVLILLIISIQFTSNDNDTNILILIVSLAIMFQSFNIIDLYFQAKVVSQYIVFVNVITLFLSSIIKIIFILNEASLIYFVIIVVFDSFIVALGYIYMYMHKFDSKLFTFKFNKQLAKSLLKESWPLIISSVGITMYLNIDQVMINNLLGSESNGYYAVSTRLSTIWYFLPFIISSTMFPAIINAKRQSEELYYSRLQKLYVIMTFLSIFIIVTMILLSNWIVTVVYGDLYIQSVDSFIILSLIGLPVAINSVWKRWLINEKKQVISLYVYILGTSLNIILNIYLIDLYGINGVAIATVISFWITLLFGFMIYKPAEAYKLLFQSLNIQRLLK